MCSNLRYKYHCIFKRRIEKNNGIFPMLEHTWHVLETNVTLQKIDFKSYLHLEILIINLLL
jgi:hypothetical protein